MTTRAPKQWALTKHETITSFENWRQNLEYTLSLDNGFSPYLGQNASWKKKTRDNPLRGFHDDDNDVPEHSRRTAVQKSATLDLMLGQIANFCPVISRNTITKLSTSLGEIWQSIRLHYGFQTSGAHFIDLASVAQGPDERPEDLYQRLLAFVNDNLLRPEFDISHHGIVPHEEEELSPTLENFITLRWLELLHPGLPALVKQRYGPELRSRTLASLKPEISQALDSLLAELRSTEDVKVLRTAAESIRSSVYRDQNRGPARTTPCYQTTAKASPRPSTGTPRQENRRGSRRCALCEAAGRSGSDTHFLSRCRFLPEADRRFMTGVRLIVGSIEDEGESDCDEVADYFRHSAGQSYRSCSQ